MEIYDFKVKDKIMYLIIGILIGAIIATTGFLIYNKLVIKNSNSSQMMQTNGNTPMQPSPDENMGEPPAKPDGENGEEPPAKPEGDNGEQPPAKPEGDNGEQPPVKPEGDNGEQPPEKPDDTNVSANS